MSMEHDCIKIWRSGDVIRWRITEVWNETNPIITLSTKDLAWIASFLFVTEFLPTSDRSKQPKLWHGSASRRIGHIVTSFQCHTHRSNCYIFQAETTRPLRTDESQKLVWRLHLADGLWFLVVQDSDWPADQCTRPPFDCSKFHWKCS